MPSSVVPAKIPVVKPSSFDLTKGVLPLMATFGRAERELAAAMLVFVLQRRGDEWTWVTPDMLVDVFLTDDVIERKVEPWARLNGNPFCPTPDFASLVTSGDLELGGDGNKWMRFTPEGIWKLERSLGPRA